MAAVTDRTREAVVLTLTRSDRLRQCSPDASPYHRATTQGHPSKAHRTARCTAECGPWNKVGDNGACGIEHNYAKKAVGTRAQLEHPRKVEVRWAARLNSMPPGVWRSKVG
jgi:hypothetical protein